MKCHAQHPPLSHSHGASELLVLVPCQRFCEDVRRIVVGVDVVVLHNLPLMQKKAIGKTCEWEHPRTPSVRLLWDGRATEAVLDFLRTTRVGCIGVESAPGGGGGGGTVRARREGQAPLRLYFFLRLSVVRLFFGANHPSCAVSSVLSFVFP